MTQTIKKHAFLRPILVLTVICLVTSVLLALTNAVTAPIMAAGDVIGAVCLLLPETGAVPGEGDVKLAQVAAAFLGRQMEE